MLCARLTSWPFAAPCIGAGLCACMVALTGCYRIPQGRLAVDKVEIKQNANISSDEIRDRIATAPSPRFLGLWQGFAYDYTYFDKFVLERDLARIERLYQARGYYDARVQAGRVIPTDPHHVRIEIVVEEGQPVTVTKAAPADLAKVPFAAQAAVMGAIDEGLKPGQVFEEEKLDATKQRIRQALMDQGHAWARVRARAMVNQITRTAEVTYYIDAGPQFKIRSVQVQGLDGKIPEKPVLRALDIEPGQLFSAHELEQSQVAVTDLGVFAQVDLSWTQPPDGQGNDEPLREFEDKDIPRNAQGEPAVDVLVRVTPAPLHLVKLGVGSEFDILRTDVHGVVGWETRNLFGNLSRFSITAKPGVVLYPTTIDNWEAPNEYLAEAKLQTEFRQPGFPEARTSTIVRGQFSQYPILLSPAKESSADVILGYREARGALGLERNFWGNRLNLALFGHEQAYFPFTYVGILDPDLRRVEIRYLEVLATISLRDDVLQPHKGILLLNSFQLAPGWLGSDVVDIKIQPDLRVYVPISRTVTFAVRSTLGLLFPSNYGESLRTPGIEDAQQVQDQQLLYFRAFFSGGPSSNRGYPYRGVGPHGPALFLAPNLSAQQLAQRCNPSVTPEALIRDDPRCSVPLGGLTLWEASAEVRYPISGALTGAVFADASDVTRTETTFHFEYLHLSAGLGLRYATPVGPVRLDVGYRVPGLQKLGGELDPETEGDPGTIFGAPISVSLAVGEAF